MAIGSLAIGAGSAALSGLSNMSEVAGEGAANTAMAKSINRAGDTITFRD